MKITRAVDRFDSFTKWLSTWFEHVAIIAFIGGMLVGTLVDVVGAKAFHWPLPGGLEVVYFSQLIAISAALAYSQIDGRQIRVELFIDRLPLKARAFFHGLAALLSLGLFIILIWKAYEYAQSLRAINEVTAAAKVPLYPFVFWLALSFIPLGLVLVAELFKAIREGFGR